MKVFIEDFRTGETLKRCSKCGQYKKLGEYHRNRSAKSGVNAQCKECHNAAERKYKSDRHRLWSRVKKQSDPPYCWIWGEPNAKNYARTWWKGEQRRVQSIIYEMSVGALPPNHYMVMICENHRCVNPSHIRVMTRGNFYAWIWNRNGDKFYGKKRPGECLQGEDHPFAQLTEEQVKYIRTQAAAGRVQRDIAREFGLSPAAINSIVKGRAWRHVDMNVSNDEYSDLSRRICPYCDFEFAADRYTRHVNVCAKQLERDQLIKSLFEQGMSKTAIAKQLGITRTRVYQILCTENPYERRIYSNNINSRE